MSKIDRAWQKWDQLSCLGWRNLLARLAWSTCKGSSVCRTEVHTSGYPRGDGVAGVPVPRRVSAGYRLDKLRRLTPRPCRSGCTEYTSCWRIVRQALLDTKCKLLNTTACTSITLCVPQSLCTSTLSRFLAACTSITLCAPHSFVHLNFVSFFSGLHIHHSLCTSLFVYLNLDR